MHMINIKNDVEALIHNNEITIGHITSLIENLQFCLGELQIQDLKDAKRILTMASAKLLMAGENHSEKADSL